MRDEERAWWEKVRARGKWRFVLLYFGVLLGFGIGTLTAVGARLYADGLSLAPFATPQFLAEWGLRLAIGFLTGSLFGLLMWRQYEKRYRGR